MVIFVGGHYLVEDVLRQQPPASLLVSDEQDGLKDVVDLQMIEVSVKVLPIKVEHFNG